MTGREIDYEALAKAGYYAQFPLGERWETEHIMWRCALRDSARAVVAALRDQGLVVARGGDLGWALDTLDQYTRGREYHPTYERYVRLRAALVAAPPDGEDVHSANNPPR